MVRRQIILENLETLGSLKDLAESYEEIAVIRMQKIKDSVLKTRDFLAELSDVFVDLKASYEREVKDLISRRKEGDTTLPPILQKKGKILLVYLASNARFYGPITQSTFRLFMQDINKPDMSNADIAVIGKVGKEMYEHSGLAKPFDFFDLPDNKVSLDDIKKLVNKFLSYEKVNIYYGKFSNVVQQIPFATSITGENIFEADVTTPLTREDRFIFEPILEKIFHFFETQIIANLFTQTILENQLARHSSRVNSMEEMLGNIEEESKKLNQLRNRMKQLSEDTKQLETISGMALWTG